MAVTSPENRADNGTCGAESGEKPTSPVRPLGLALPLGALFSLLVSPNRFGLAFGGPDAAVFAGMLLVGIGATCGAVALAGRMAGGLGAGAQSNIRSLGTWLLPVGIGTLAGLFAAGINVGPAVAAACGVAAGIGMACALLVWAQTYASLAAGQALVGAILSCGLAAIPGFAFAALPQQSPALWWVLAALCVGAALASSWSGTPEALRAAGATAMPWQPLVGLALSLISMTLPWGAFLEESATSVPPLWGVALGWAVPAIIMLASCSGRPSRLKMGSHVLALMMNIGIPALAALTMALWMVGDTTDIAPWVGALKGVGSGIACTGLFCLAWMQMTRPTAGPDMAASCANGESYAREADAIPGVAGDETHGAMAAGSLAFVFLAAALILPVHALFGRNAAGTISPVASLLFLVAVCVDSAIRLSRGGDTQPQPAAALNLDGQAAPANTPRADGQPSSMDASWPGDQAAPSDATARAVATIAEERGLSQREQEVLGCLMGARSVDGIAAELGISPHTVRTHVRRIHEKLGVSSRDEIVTLVEARR